MPISTETEKIEVILKLNNGSTTTGAVKTVNVKVSGSAQKISPTVYNADIATARQKAYNIGIALEPCLAKTVYYTQEVLTSQLSN